ncbi:MAG: hypothetical protein WAO12_00650 [Venatoribacter sp.]
MPLPILAWVGISAVTGVVAYVAKEYFSDDSSSSSSSSNTVDIYAIKKRQARDYALTQARALALEFGADADEIDEYFLDEDDNGFPVINQQRLHEFLLDEHREYHDLTERKSNLTYYIDLL